MARENEHVDRPQGGGRQPRPLAERLWERIDQSGGPDACHPWTGSTKNGYGQISEGGRDGRDLYAHRVVYEMKVSPIPDGLFLLHSCDNRPCCNERHLSPGTPAENMADMARKGRGRKAGTGPRGERHHAAKLSRQIIADARAAVEGGETRASVARRLNVNHVTITRALEGRTWK